MKEWHWFWGFYKAHRIKAGSRVDNVAFITRCNQVIEPAHHRSALGEHEVSEDRKCARCKRAA